MHFVTNWTVKRSGHSMTVRGLGADGKPVKITHIVRVEPSEWEGRPAIVATRRTSPEAVPTLYRLALEQ